jgi:TonB family protein
MMNPNVRVSVLERLVPSIAFIVAAISGAAGGAMLIRFFYLLSQSENAGYAAFFGGTVEIEYVVIGVLVVAAVLCAVGILVSIIRLFTTNTKASPPGLLFLMTGLLSIVPVFALHYVMHMMKGVLISPHAPEGGISSVASTIITVAYFAIGAAVVIALVLIAFSFVPFSSRSGRKSSPIICLMLVEIIFATLIGIFFWEARTSVTERDKVRDFYSDPASSSSEPSSDTDSDIDTNSNTYHGAANTNSGLKGRTISGGVLNSKAIAFPQPDYPSTARAVRATGNVIVQVTVDENGEVTSATAVTGHPMLRPAAVEAARQARFNPTKLSGQPVKVSGVLTYSFTGQ